MHGKSFKIDDKIIDPAYIIMIDLDAQTMGFGDDEPESAVRITLSAISGEFGAMSNSGSWDPATLLYTGSQAEALRPWLAAMFPCEGRSFRLPELAKAEEENDPAYR